MGDNTVLSGGAVGAIRELTGQALGTLVEIDGLAYSTTPIHDPRKREPEPESVVVHTLQGFADLVKREGEQSYTSDRGFFVHVESPEDVVLLTGIFGTFNQRVQVARAEAVVPDLALDRFHDPESFIIELLARFKPDQGREDVFRVVGHLREEAVRTLDDDGVTQTATGRVGVVTKENVKVPCPVMLTPYRTFSEVEQVQSPFVLRLRGGGEGRLPTCALFECDGGIWRLEAISRIKAWLQGELGDVAPVYG